MKKYKWIVSRDATQMWIKNRVTVWCNSMGGMSGKKWQAEIYNYRVIKVNGTLEQVQTEIESLLTKLDK